MTVRYERPVRFEEVDAAQIVFFARFFNLCHEAMERMFDPLDGGYVRLITERYVGFPAVHVDCDWKASLRYGDVAVIDTDVVHVGTTSATLRYQIRRRDDNVHCATIKHVIVAADLRSREKCPLPLDCRAILDTHLIRGT